MTIYGRVNLTLPFFLLNLYHEKYQKKSHSQYVLALS